MKSICLRCLDLTNFPQLFLVHKFHPTEVSFAVLFWLECKQSYTNFSHMNLIF
eukprot:08846.XXX_281686_281844_1 [CDS] Oithona nana genome sequencing.